MIRSRDGVVLGAGDTVLYWRLWAPSRPRAAMLLVHGLGEHSGRYQMFAETLSGRGYAVFAYDQRGHGRSRGSRGHIDRFEDLVSDFDAALSDMRDRLGHASLPTVAMGHSMGALVVLATIQRAPDPWVGAVLSAPWLATKAPVPAWKRRLGEMMEGIWPSAPFSAPLPPEHLTRDPAMQRAKREDPLNHARISPRMFFEVERVQEMLRAGWGPYPPTLLLVPGADPVADADVSAEWGAARADWGVETVGLPGLRHEPLNEVEREDVYKTIGDWLDARLPT